MPKGLRREPSRTPLEFVRGNTSTSPDDIANDSEPPPPSATLAGFIAKWRQSAAAESANSQSFLNDLCRALGVPRPRPTTGDAKRDQYVFEKSVRVSREGGAPTVKKIDLYKHACFALESKQGSDANTGRLGTAKRKTPAWNVAMGAAFGQALEYAQFLDEPPPFIIVADIGYCFDLYACFDGTTNYRPFPSALAHRLYMADLDQHAPTLRAVFTAPLTLDQSRHAVRVTREVAGHLAELSRRLEAAGHGPQTVAAFLMRCIFTMFAEDVGLLPTKIFSDQLRTHWLEKPKSFPAGIESLWRAMNEGTAFGFFGKLLHFNGGLFRLPSALPLARAELEILNAAAKCTWRDVEPAIFGTLFEKALDAKERHGLGAHFTPRAYVERLVRPTIEEPLRLDWDNVQKEVRRCVESNKLDAAKAATRAFLKRLSETRVLDPACGSGNFLYVAMDILKRIEDEVFAMLLALEKGQADLCLDAPEVSPKQFLGIEINPRAKEITELVLWIGYLQWHFRTKHRGGMPREPVLQDYKNIECRDAVLAYDDAAPRRDARGKVIMRWDGETMKHHPTTGELVPDETFTRPVYSYSNPREAMWPAADYIAGNPPFVGNFRMRAVLGEGYTEALRASYAKIPDSVDLVMYWWDRAARLVRDGGVKRAGFITTTSITQTLNRRIVQQYLGDEKAVSLLFGIADHPWTSAKYDQANGGAEVRTAMTVLGAGQHEGLQGTVAKESEAVHGEVCVELTWSRGVLNADLSIGANVAACSALRSNQGLSARGVMLHGPGFIVTFDQAKTLGLRSVRGLEKYIRPYRNGQDLASKGRNAFVIDLDGLSIEDVRRRFPGVYQWVLERVKPERDQNAEPYRRNNWWLFGRRNTEMRSALAGVQRYIATIESARRRYFVFLDGGIIPDNALIAIGLTDAFYLGILSSRIHVTWSLAAGGRLGVRHDPRYNKTRCFEPFPFPDCNRAITARVRDLAEQIDAHRKRQQAQHPRLTLTKLYKSLDACRAGIPLDKTDKAAWETGLGATLLSLHDDLDRAVFDAYGWQHDVTDDQVIKQLVALNAARIAEEKRGVIRWLRPDFQSAEAENATPEARGPGVAKSRPPKGPSAAEASPKLDKSKARKAAL
jgi:hypothetical protein